MLIEGGADANARDCVSATPLHCAAWCGNYTHWIKRNGKLAAKNAFVFLSGHEKVAKLLIENGAVVNIKGSADVTPLFAAAASGSFLIIKF